MVNKRKLSSNNKNASLKRWEKQQAKREKARMASEAAAKKKRAEQQRERGVEQNRGCEDTMDEEAATAPCSSKTATTTRHEDCRQRIQRAEQELQEVRRLLTAEQEQRQQQAIQHQNEMAQVQQQLQQQKQELEQARQQLHQQKQELEQAQQQQKQQKQELEHARQQLHQHQYATQALQQRNGQLMRQNVELLRANDEQKQRRVQVQPPPPPINDENIEPKRGRPALSFSQKAERARRSEINQTVKTVLGEETASCLRFAFAEIARQLTDLTTIDDIPIQLFITGDLMFLSRAYGHRGPASAFPCIACEAQKLPSEPGSIRTIARMTHQAEQFQQGQQAGSNETQLSKQFGAIQFTPLFNIEPSMVIPPSLHIVACQGVFKGIFQELRHLCSRNNAEEELELRLRALGAYKNAWYQEYSGYHVRNILRDEGPAHVTTFLPPSPQRDRIRQALELLSRLQSFAAAERLDNERIISFRTTADQFRQHMQQHFAAHCTTPKFHHLVYHAPDFAAEHGFWGLLSEQPMERFHADFNNALARKANTKDMHDILMFCARESLLRNAIFDAGEM